MKKILGTFEKKPNPYRKGTMIWALYEEDWSDLTIEQIAEVFSSTEKTVSFTMRKITKQTGYRVPHMLKRKVRAGQ